MALAWAVTSLENPDAIRFGVEDWREQRRSVTEKGEYVHRYHQSWRQSEEILERESINMGRNDAGQCVAWKGRISDFDTAPMFHGETLLVAALRCHCASHYGEVIDVPDALL